MIRSSISCEIKWVYYFATQPMWYLTKKTPYHCSICLPANINTYKGPISSVHLLCSPASSVLLGNCFHEQLHITVYSQCTCLSDTVQKFTTISTCYTMCYASSSEVELPHHLLKPALASLCLVLEHLCKGRLLPLQDLGLCRRPQSIGKKKNWEVWKLKKGKIHECGGFPKQKAPWISPP